jgi:hypothetical protein
VKAEKPESMIDTALGLNRPWWRQLWPEKEDGPEYLDTGTKWGDRIMAGIIYTVFVGPAVLLAVGFIGFLVAVYLGADQFRP